MNMDGNLSWDLEELQDNYNKLRAYIEELRQTAAEDEKNNNELRENWSTKGSQVYFAEAEKTRQEVMAAINEYEKVCDEILRRIQVLKAIDEA